MNMRMKSPKKNQSVPSPPIPEIDGSPKSMLPSSTNTSPFLASSSANASPHGKKKLIFPLDFHSHGFNLQHKLVLFYLSVIGKHVR